MTRLVMPGIEKWLPELPKIKASPISTIERISRRRNLLPLICNTAVLLAATGRRKVSRPRFPISIVFPSTSNCCRVGLPSTRESPFRRRPSNPRPIVE